MSTGRASEKRVEEPVKDGRLQLDLIPVKVPSKQPSESPLEVTSECERLVVHRANVPGSKGSDHMYQSGMYTGVHHYHTGRTVVMRRREAEAKHIYKLLNKCFHSNVLKPSGAWESGGLVSLTFPRVEGTLDHIDSMELFITDSTGKKDGFTKEGRQFFRDIISAVDHINEKAYSKGAVATSSSTITEDNNAPPLPLQLVAERIYYQKLDGTGFFHVYIGDFYDTINIRLLPRTLRNDVPKIKKAVEDQDVESIKKFNWKGLGSCLKNLIGSNANEELIHLQNVLKDSSSITLDDIMWEPALWDSATKMLFIREVSFSIKMDSTKARKAALKKGPPLGLQDVAALLGLGLEFREDNLHDSVKFLRNKIVAHQDDLYVYYEGDKRRDIGVTKSTLERLLVKEKPDYMLKLVEHIRPLKWITQSPVLRSKTEYMKALTRVLTRAEEEEQHQPASA